MPDLTGLVTVPLDQLHVAVQAAGPLDLGLLDEHVATTLPAPPDGKNPQTNRALPQQNPTPGKPNPAQTRTPPPKPRELPTINRGKQG